jgi:hypothetical protein
MSQDVKQVAKESKIKPKSNTVITIGIDRQQLNLTFFSPKKSVSAEAIIRLDR